VTRARERFGFSAATGLREGLQQTVAWYESTRGKD
jgi:nucleoside-diphosphate-sugar epimerase